MVRLLFVTLLVLPLALFLPGARVYAHGLGDRYDLPVPLWLYLYGAGAAVLVSFVVIGIFIRSNPFSTRPLRYNLLRHLWLRALLNNILFLTFFRLISVSLFGLLIATSFWGSDIPTQNFAPPFIWVGWWVGMGFVFAFVANCWALLNPWKIIFEWAEKAYSALTSGRQLGLGFRYPEELGITPAIVLFFGFAWIENVYVNAANPKYLGSMILVYSAITLAGMLSFGKHTWLHHGDAFSVLYRFLCKFAVTEVRVTKSTECALCELGCLVESEECVNCYACYERAKEGREINIRPPGVGLAYPERARTSEMVFVILALATVTFDGFKETSKWVDIRSNIFPRTTFYDNSLTMTLGLAIFPILFIAAYLLISYFIVRFSRQNVSLGTVARAFVYSLVPIALAYNVAHFFSILAVSGQLIVRDASDPFGWGWDLFGTADYLINIAIVSPRLVWFVGVVAIILGHMIAIYIAHTISMRVMDSRSAALKSQYPMVALMVGYTIVSLWIIAQPIIFEA